MDASVNTSFDLSAWTAGHALRVERALSSWVAADAPAGLGEAMRYAVLDGGKRLRPLLVLASAEAVAEGLGPAARQALDEAALRAACAVELIHAYSLVHDDMPCMENGVLRRGKPTVHVQFGEARALLAGDALQALAFELLTPESAPFSAAVQARLCRLLARAAGFEGMAGGQAIDLASVGAVLDENQLRRMHRLKTGALLRGSVLMGAACRESDGVIGSAAVTALADYGDAIGLAFQVVDDILDVTTDTSTLGKDAAADKPTYVSVLGLDRSRAYAAALHDQADAALDRSGLGISATQALRALAAMVVQRDR